MNKLPPDAVLATKEAATYAQCQTCTLRKHAAPVGRLRIGERGRPVDVWRVSDLEEIRSNVKGARNKAEISSDQIEVLAAHAEKISMLWAPPPDERVCGGAQPVKIESNIPPPDRPHHSVKYNWHLMGVGDSQLFSDEQGYRAAKAAHNFASRYGWKFISETQPDGSVRVWRVS